MPAYTLVIFASILASSFLLGLKKTVSSLHDLHEFCYNLLIICTNAIIFANNLVVILANQDSCNP
jgi:hypothetical protein